MSTPSPTGRLERRYRRLLIAYPRAYRSARSEEMIATLMSATPDRRWPSVPDAADLLPIPPGAGRARRAWWLLSRGLPWLAQHSGRVAPAVMSMAVEAIRDQRREGGASVLAVGQQPAARAAGCLISAVSGGAAQSLPGRGVSGVGQGARTPEVTRAAG